MELKHVVLPGEDGEKVSHILRDKLNISARLLNKLKMHEKILVNNVPVFSSHIVNENDIIIVKIDAEEECNIIPQNIPLDILYEDEYILAVNKSANMVVHPSSYHPDNTLSNGVRFYLNNNKTIRPINRLDKDTSGIVLFAKNEYIQERMNSIASKEYIAIVCGNMSTKKGIINEPIARKPGSIMEREINYKIGQKAITHYKVIKNYAIDDESLSLLRLKLETRTHASDSCSFSQYWKSDFRRHIIR